MTAAFLTTDDPLHLPAFFARVLDRRAPQTRAVYIVPPLYGKQTPLQAAWRYYKSFGVRIFLGLGWRVLRAKIKGESIASVCQKYGVGSAEVADVNAPDFVERLRDQPPDVLISVSCPQIFRPPLIALPPRGILNIHGAILPRYRGVMPSFWMLANGEKQAGVSIYFVDEKIDAGSLCAQRVFDIHAGETLDQFVRRSKAIAADLLLEVWRGMEEGEVPCRALDLSEGSYYSWPDAGAFRRFRAAGRRFW